MRQIFWILLFFPLSLFAQEHFYYYKGQKQYLQLDTNYVFVTTTNESVLQKSNVISGVSLVLNKEQHTRLLSKKQNISAEFYWTEIQLPELRSRQPYKEKINAIKQIDGVQVVSPYFRGKKGEKIGLSNFFYVKLKSLSDTTLLNRYSIKNNVVVIKQDMFMPLWFALSCTKQSEGNAMDMANKFYESQMFQYAEPDLMVDDLLNCTNDTFFPNQWGLHNTGQYGGTNGVDIRACDAWRLSTGAGVNVAVIDQGIELNHPDLRNNIHPLSFDTETRSTPSIMRGNHGIACAGIIGAMGNNSAGIRGVASNARLMSVSNRLQITPNIREQLALGINWAVQNDADIINNSWGSNELVSSLIDDAITNAVTNGRSGLGCIVIFATGNDNSTVNYPANSNPAILAVGAISPCGQRKRSSSRVWEVGPGVTPDPQGVSCDGETRWGSNFGHQLDVVAPGVLIPTTDRQENFGYNPNERIHIESGGNLIPADYTNRDYTVWFNGTSAAAPHVAGVAALILSIRPDLTGQQVRNIIEQTARKVGNYQYATTAGRPNGTWNQEMGYGLVDAYAAVYAVAPRISGPVNICNSPVTYTIENLPENVPFAWSVSSDMNFIRETGNSITVERGQHLSHINPTAYVIADIGEPFNTLVANERIIVWKPGINETTTLMNVSSTIDDLNPLNSTHTANLQGELLYTGSSNFRWTVSDGLEMIFEDGTMAYFKGNINSPYAYVAVDFMNPCGEPTQIVHRFSSNNFSNNSPFSLYPNPATDQVTLNLPAKTSQNFSILSKAGVNKTTPSGITQIQLWSGAALLKSYQTTESTYQISVENLPKGIYFVVVIKDGKRYSQKLIKK